MNQCNGDNALCQQLFLFFGEFSLKVRYNRAQIGVAARLCASYIYNLEHRSTVLLTIQAGKGRRKLDSGLIFPGSDTCYFLAAVRELLLERLEKGDEEE